MAANRKKGKKPQNSNQGKSSNKNAPATAAEPVSDNSTAVADSAEIVSVNRMTGAAAPPSASSGSTEDQNTSATEPAEDGQTIETNVGTGSIESNASATESKVGSEPDSVANRSGGDAATAVSEPAADTASEPEHAAEPVTATGADEYPASQPDSVGPDNEPKSQTAVVAEEISAADSVTTQQPLTSDQSEIKITAKPEDTAATPQTVATPEPSTVDVNFAKDEIRTLLVPVSPFNRLVACIMVIFSYSILGYIILKTPAGLNAQGMHTIDLPDAGSWVFFFRGDTQDPFGWGVGGRFRESLEIEMEPVEPQQKVEKIEPIKDLSGTGFFSVAEFEVNQPGKYNLWIKWNDPNAKCKGKIQYEKDPVETFFFKWALGIVGTIALFYMVGIPMTTRKAQSTLPDSLPPVVSK